jgi:hypothetical protein
MIRILLLTLLISSSAWSYDKITDLGKKFGQHACWGRLSLMTAEWGSSDSWQRTPPSEPDQESFKTPTGTVGAWIEFKAVSREIFQLTKMSARSSLIVTLDQSSGSCKSASVVKNYKYNEEYLKKAYTDESLERTLKAAKKGLIYMWSPNMPLSVTNLQYLSKQAKELGVKLVVTVDPATPKELIKMYVDQGKIRPEWTRPMESFDLINRGALIHFPAFIPFKDGKPDRGPKLGYENEVQTMKFLKENVL